jgi:hypothetical protein
MLAPSKQVARLSSTTILDLNNLILVLTRRLVRAASFLVLSRSRNIESTNTPPVTVHDARTVIDLLSLPRNFAPVFYSLPRRLHDMGVTLTEGKFYNRKLGMKGIEKIVTPEIAETIISIRPPSNRARSDSRSPWPEKWNYNHGFSWEVESSEQHEPDEVISDEEMEISSGFVQTPEIQEGLQWISSSPSVCENEETDMEEFEEELLDAETRYLDAFDAQLAQLEQTRLIHFIKRGEALSRQNYRTSLKSFTLNNLTMESKREFETAQTRIEDTFGAALGQWCLEKTGIERSAEELHPREWEFFHKRNPSMVHGRVRKRKNSMNDTEPRKRAALKEEDGSDDGGLDADIDVELSSDLDSAG